ncbi:MAG: chromosome segregation protein SMC [Pseudomonadota bacterium]
MKIKKIFVTGFKSFADRLEVPFPEGISAIVGPNGCGKSNVVDAIRWAMGEQSAKLLRGRQMEDVIFNGAENHKPLGMAEVSLIFENGNGSFPAEFAQNSEISVTRRLYRSGESEYLVNNVPCRLKDIQEIFMDTGLGNRAYSIIGQGKISSIVEQKPEETRAMLEEAAGITKYKKKVDEAQRKIELTRGNLLRVEDILIEVERQMRTLKRQAGKARRFKNIVREIERLDLLLNANAYHALKEESGDRMKSTEGLVQEEIALSTKLSGIQAEIETMNLELDEKDQEISRRRDVYLQIKEKVNRKESILESMAGEKRMQGELGNRLKKEREDLERRLGELENEKRSLKQRIEEAGQKAARLEEEMAVVNTRVKSRQDALKEAKEEFEEARTRLNSGVSKEMSLSQESGYLNNRIGEITDSRTRLEREREEVLQKIEEINQGSQRKNQVREALSQKLGQIEEDIRAKQGELDDLVLTKKASEGDLKSVEADLNMSESRLTTLRSMTENFEGYKVGVRTIMKADDLDAKRSGRIMGLVADKIQVESRYEQAVEAVMGDKLQYIIVERQADGKEAVDYLKLRAKGRGTFVPLRDLNGNQNNGHQNGFPLLRDLISVDEPYKDLMNLLLGNTAMVKDLGEAISAWSSNGKDQSLVTLDGDMVDRSGVISGGKLAHSSHGILARKREIGELQKKVTTLNKDREALVSRIEKTGLEIEARESALEGLKEEKYECQEQINELDKTIFRLSHELDQMERLSAKIAQDLEDKNREQDRHREALTRIQSELEQCKERRKQFEEYVSEKEFELKESEEEFEQFRNELTGLQMDHNRTQEEAKGFRRELERIGDFTEEARHTLERIGGEIEGAKALYGEYLQREETLRESLKGFYGELEEAEEQVHSAEQDRGIFHNGIREAEKRGEALRGELEVLKETVHRARMAQSEIRFKMESMVETVREKFNLGLEEVYRENLQEDFSPVEVKARMDHQKKLKERLGEVNLTAIQEHEALKERHTFITEQREDLLKSIESLNQAIRKINRTSLEKFQTTFAEVDKKLKEVFPILFNGGEAGLKLVDETKPLESGVLVEVKPPGKKLSHMGLLSGGEKALVAMALLFAIYLIKPSPFCLLDEVDAPLDEANIDRFNDLLKEIRKVSQIILVTHNRRSMEIVDRLYGITMEKKGVSKMVSVSLQGFHQN